jgi:hypothetical protein
MKNTVTIFQLSVTIAMLLKYRHCASISASNSPLREKWANVLTLQNR